jgi:hypothetical protein
MYVLWEFLGLVCIRRDNRMSNPHHSQPDVLAAGIHIHIQSHIHLLLRSWGVEL